MLLHTGDPLLHRSLDILVHAGGLTDRVEHMCSIQDPLGDDFLLLECG